MAEMHHHHYYQQGDRSYPSSDRHLFLDGGNVHEDTGLVLSTDAKPRLKWTAELHERFLEAVIQLGGADKATPKTVMKLMAIPGLTLYHLKSHLQKYRLSKNLHGQTTIGNNKSGDRLSDVSGSLMNNTSLGVQTDKSLQISEALQMQIEVQRRLHQQLEVQKHLQLRIEAQGKYLQSVLEKAQETLGGQNLEASKVPLSALVPKVSTKTPNCGISSHGEQLTNLCDQQTQTTQPRDCSTDSCLTTCERGSQIQKSPTELCMNIKVQGEKRKGRDEKFVDEASTRRSKLDLNAHEDNEESFDLNGFSWNG
ncbi:hypothetical protein GIB67_006697 [Kingdonia uniflora]|uniref:HTH myb-type domain-containing protein n=1 Tax=Kingdonia uniflora TaxID=39325 RepID=A0A7J7LYT5_9MAGN|nr:hypothetical protein GIB67_006697 [Kingdonia uniflora]